ncbi:hypothetical protein ASD11_13285 [Aeromicrobium sp. Root495]|uniref:bile acid:sodium symporter family protein n=1 Tax=Aeromicrobium sp. Root495 TaxID=1736550 RepID=UPI0006FABD48|nr:bile acid:sodium symporter family protein [Aeromicrobium sp. Root495]KQY60416.1 hypothetical protein ASD11_13285 [Aeromicrobium sp. Root495]
MRARVDPFIVALLATALLGTFLPARGQGLDVLTDASRVVLALLFFLYGARLSTSETLAGLRHWRLHVLVLTITFVAFPALGLVAHQLQGHGIDAGLADGILFLTLVPTTVQSCVVFTRVARGNEAGTVVSASLSSIVGVFLTPLLVSLLMSANAQVDAGSIVRIVLQILVPFVLGQALRPWVGAWVERHDGPLKLYDRGSILVIVYLAFSEGARAHVWLRVTVPEALVVVAVCAVLLGVALVGAWQLGRLAGLGRADRVSVLFAGSNKSLAAGLPIATVLFSGGQLALIILPLMAYHQLQLITCAVVSGRMSRTPT